MLSSSTRSRLVWVAVGVVTAAVFATVVVLAGAEQATAPETASELFGSGTATTMPPHQPKSLSLSTIDETVPESSATQVQGSKGRGDVQAAGESDGGSDRGAFPPAIGDAAGNDQIAVEKVEWHDSGWETAVGGALRETPVEPAGSDGSDTGSGGASSAQGPTYAWQDGNRVLEAQLQSDLVMAHDGSIISTEQTPAGKSDGKARGSDEPPRRTGGSDGHPVFRSESGELMTLPGGVILILDPAWDDAAVKAFFSANGISSKRVSELEYLPNGFMVDTEPGFPSLNLANALVGQAGVELSSPNWRRDRTTR